jgi:protein-L-isoaspartate O-methyltransferase
MAEFDARSISQQWKVELLKSLVPSGELLEVGPATGEFAFAARKCGYVPTLLEMDEKCCRFLSDKLGLAVRLTADPATSFDGNARYDAICIWQAIEHIPEVWKLMRVAASRLTRGGAMILSTPNPESFQARLLGRYWPHLDAPRHLYLIPRGWMRSFADQNSLTVVLDTTRDVGSIGLNYYGWYLAVRNALRRRISDGTVARMAARLTSLFRSWEEAEGGGCSYTIALRRL